MNAETPAEIRTAVLLSHTQPEQTTEAVGKALAAAKAHGCRLYAPASELAKHGDAAAGIDVAHRASTASPTSAWCSAATARS